MPKPTIEQQLKKTMESADVIYITGDYFSAAILYSRAILLLADYHLIKKLGATPKDHEERLRLIGQSNQQVIDLITDTKDILDNPMKQTIDKKSCELLKAKIESAAKALNMEL